MHFEKGVIRTYTAGFCEAHMTSVLCAAGVSKPTLHIYTGRDHPLNTGHRNQPGHESVRPSGKRLHVKNHLDSIFSYRWVNPAHLTTLRSMLLRQQNISFGEEALAINSSPSAMNYEDLCPRRMDTFHVVVLHKACGPTVCLHCDLRGLDQESISILLWKWLEKNSHTCPWNNRSML